MLARHRPWCFLFVLLLVAIVNGNNHEEAEKTTCQRILAQATHPSSPFKMVGHTIHSLTVRDLRRFFDPDATEINFVPTINRNLTADAALLPHAPDIKSPGDEGFLMDEMKSINLVLSHMDDPNWDMRRFNALEKISHMFHMVEEWGRTAQKFRKIRASPPPEEVCDCVMDIESNGILEFMRTSALAIREPALIYGGGLPKQTKRSGYPAYRYNQKQKSTGEGGYSFVSDPTKQNGEGGYSFLSDPAKQNGEGGYTFSGKRKRSAGVWDRQHFPTRHYHAADKSLEHGLLRTKGESMPRLVDGNAWKKYREMFLVRHDGTEYNTALFLYCAIEKAHKGENRLK